MSGFSNPVSNALGTLVRTALQSLGFVTGVTGWRIAKDGSAEFNGSVFRGTVTVGPFMAGGSRVDITNQGGLAEILLTPPDQAGVTITPAAIDAFAQGAGSPQPVIEFDSPSFNGHVHSLITLQGVSADGLTPARIEIFADTTGKVVVTALNTSFAGNVSVDNGVDASVNGVAETWHNMVYQNGWTTADFPAQYRHVASPNGDVEFMGSIGGGTSTPGTTIGNLPAGYRPNKKRLLPMAAGTTVAGAASPRIVVGINGDVVIDGGCTGSGFIFWSVIFATTGN